MEKKYGVFSNENRIFSLAKQSRFLPNVFLAVIIFLVVMNVSEIVAIFPRIILRNLYMLRGLNGKAFAFAINDLALPFGLVILGFFAWVRFVEKRPIYTMGFEKKNFVKKYVRGFIIGFLMMAVCAGTFAVLGLVKINYSNPSIKGINALSGVLIVLIGWIIQGASEEVMVRGWLMPVIGSRNNAALGIFISAIIFGALHLLNNNIGALPIINLVLYGVFAALFVIWEGGLWGACALHSAWNWTQGNIFGFEVSGTVAPGGILIDLDTIIGKDLVTGGAFGVEGGLVCSTVLTIGIIILIMLINRRKTIV